MKTLKIRSGVKAGAIATNHARKLLLALSLVVACTRFDPSGLEAPPSDGPRAVFTSKQPLTYCEPPWITTGCMVNCPALPAFDWFHCSNDRNVYPGEFHIYSLTNWEGCCAGTATGVFLGSGQGHWTPLGDWDSVWWQVRSISSAHANTKYFYAGPNYTGIILATVPQGYSFSSIMGSVSSIY